MSESTQAGDGTAVGCVRPEAPVGTHRLSGLTIFDRPDGDRMVASVRGDLDLDMDDDLRSALIPLLVGSDGHLDLDLGDVTRSGHPAVSIHLTISRPCPDGSRAEPEKDPHPEVAQLRRALRSRGTIDLARGILVATFGLGPQDAWEVLVAVSQRTNIKLHLVARHLLDSTCGTAPLPAAIQQQLSAAVAGRRSPDTSQAGV